MTTAAPRLEFAGVECRYGHRTALKGLSLAVAQGEIVAVLGPNGAGKSTLVKAASGALRPSAGEIRFDGSTAARPARLSGLVPQSIALFGRLTVSQNLLTFGALMGIARAELDARVGTVLAQIDLRERADERVDSLSGGMQRRVNIGAALMHEPTLLLLDEPMVGVDRDARRRLGEIFRAQSRRGLGVLLVTHDFDEAERIADRVAILAGGELRAFGTVAELTAAAFGQHRVARLEFDDGAGTRPPLPDSFRALGDGVFEGLVELRPGALDALLERCRAGGGDLREVRVTRPGLEALVQHFTAGPAAAA